MISNRIGFSFPTPVVGVGIFMAIAGLFFAATESVLSGLVIAIIGGFLCANSYGTELDMNLKKYREYTAVYGLKTGEWKLLKTRPFIGVLTSRSSQKTYSRSNRSTTLMTDSFDVCLLNQNHREKTVVKKLDTRKNALKYAEELASLLGVEIVQYNPEISEKTKARRRK